MEENIENKVVFEYDAENNIVFVDDSWDIRTREDVDQFFERYGDFVRKVGRKFWMVAHIDNLIVHAGIAEYYGEVAHRTVREHLLGFARWGSNARARMTVRTTALKAKMAQNIYDTREDAIRAIEEMKKRSEKESS